MPRLNTALSRYRSRPLRRDERRGAYLSLGAAAPAQARDYELLDRVSHTSRLRILHLSNHLSAAAYAAAGTGARERDFPDHRGRPATPALGGSRRPGAGLHYATAR